MTSANLYGDFEITDPKTMRALAHPVRLALLERLQRHGPATASQLAPHVGATPSVTSWHLRHLARFGLVRDAEPGADRRERRWGASSRGFRFSSSVGGEEGRAAARQLADQMFERASELSLRCQHDVLRLLRPARAAGVLHRGQQPAQHQPVGGLRRGPPGLRRPRAGTDRALGRTRRCRVVPGVGGAHLASRVFAWLVLLARSEAAKDADEEAILVDVHANRVKHFGKGIGAWHEAFEAGGRIRVGRACAVPQPRFGGWHFSQAADFRIA